MSPKDLLFEPVNVVAIPVVKARFCADCDVIVKEKTCPLCASKTHQIMGVNLSKNVLPNQKEVHHHVNNHDDGRTFAGCPIMEMEGVKAGTVHLVSGNGEHYMAKISDIGKKLAE